MILFRYLSQEALKTMIAVTIALMAIIMSGRFVKYLAQVSAGNLAPDFLFLIMFYRLPNFLEMILPLGFFIGILLAYGRLYVDSEMTVMSACGVSSNRLLGYTLIPGFAVAALVALLSLVVSPKGVLAYERLLQNSEMTEAGLRTALEGRFRHDTRNNRVTYVERVARDGSSMRGVFMLEVIPDEHRPLVGVVYAERGFFELDAQTGQRFLVLEEGRRFVGEPGAVDYQMASFDRFGQWLHEPRPRTYREEIDSQSTLALLASSEDEAQATLQWRISLAVLVLVVTLLAVALSRTTHRGGRYGKLFPAFTLYVLYLVSLNAARDAIAQGRLPVYPGMLWVHLLFLGVALLLFYGPDGLRLLRSRRRRSARLTGATA